MKWSLPLGRLAGIEVKVHATFVLILAWVALISVRQGQSLSSGLRTLVFVLAIFGCVVLHELGHALAARRYGVRTRDIILLPIGGVARLERIPEKPMQELVIALAGPLVNVVIAGALFLTLAASGNWTPVVELVGDGPLLERLALVNGFIAVFNLLPAFPMDGGRVLRALLATRLRYVHATQIAASVGQAFALLLGFAGLFLNPFLVFIALFVWIGAQQEASMVRMRECLSGIPVEKVMLTDFRSLRPQDPLARAVELTLSGSQRDFPVLDGRRAVGIVTQKQLLTALAGGKRDLPISAVMDREFEVADAGAMVEPVFRRLGELNTAILPVVRGGDLAGLLTAENVAEFCAIRAALQN